MEFTTLLDPEQFPGQKKGLFNIASLDWPYTEGLRLDEALHPLTLLTVGLYGQVLAEPERGACPGRDPLEVRVQERQVHRAHPPHRHRAEDGMEQERAPGVRLLFQREPHGGPSALEPGHRAAHRRVPPAEDADVQRLRRPGRLALHGDGSEEVLLQELLTSSAGAGGSPLKVGAGRLACAARGSWFSAPSPATSARTPSASSRTGWATGPCGSCSRALPSRRCASSSACRGPSACAACSVSSRCSTRHFTSGCGSRSITTSTGRRWGPIS